MSRRVNYARHVRDIRQALTTESWTTKLSFCTKPEIPRILALKMTYLKIAMFE